MADQSSKDYQIPYKKVNEIRQIFLRFFEERAHTFVPSDAVAPKDDPSIFFTNSGMNQFKGLFLGESSSHLKRAVNSQKCLRVSGKHNDLEEVGLDGTHHTFFEMLGSWSFGDYYKKEIIKWAWELLTEVYKIPKNRLFVTVYKDDDEAEQLWKSETDIEHHRIMRFDTDNFWEMGNVGPCGPCSEIHFDKGDLATQDKFYNDPVLGVNGENERFVEIWNLVFMQFERLNDGSLKELNNKHVDTGAGLERLCAVIQNKNSNYDTDVFSPIVHKIAEITGVPYDQGDKGVPHRVMSDHIRALAFAVCDGITPGNEGRGYVIRRILRRASRFAYNLGQHKPCLYKLVKTLVENMGHAYPDLKERQSYIEQVIESEEARFLKTLGQGLQRFDKLKEKLQKEKKTVISGEDVFLFHDTFGFPVDLTRVLAGENKLTLDEEGYKKCMNEQKDRARKASKFSGDLMAEDSWTILQETRETKFTGYEHLKGDAKTLRFCEVGDEIYVVLDQTPFYAESGGQVGDKGYLVNEEVKLEVLDTFKILDLHVHRCQLSHGLFKAENLGSFKVEVDAVARYGILRNHSATHLLHAALQEVLGDHIAQQGSYVGPEHLRFDFTHHQSLTKEELSRIEDLVNEKIRENLEIETAVQSIDEAKKSGAKALFGEKYGETVRVLTMGDFSKELCGGTHAKRTGDIGGLAILSESSIASGVRRIEAITGKIFSDYVLEQKQIVSDLAQTLKVDSKTLQDKVTELLKQNKEQSKLIDKFNEENILAYTKSLVEKPVFDCEGTPVYLWNLDSNLVQKKQLQMVLDKVQNFMEEGVAVMAYGEGDSFNLLVAVGRESLKKFHAGKIVQTLAGFFDGRGGGRPDKAQAGIKQEPKMEILRKKVQEIL